MALESENGGTALQPEHPPIILLQVSCRQRTRSLGDMVTELSSVGCPCRVLFCSSVLNLCELAALRPDLARLKKVLYFHENQLVYPVRKEQNRDFQYGYNQVLSWYGRVLWNICSRTTKVLLAVCSVL